MSSTASPFYPTDANQLVTAPIRILSIRSSLKKAEPFKGRLRSNNCGGTLLARTSFGDITLRWTLLSLGTRAQLLKTRRADGYDHTGFHRGWCRVL
jgi:hypothetical protein